MTRSLQCGQIVHTHIFEIYSQHITDSCETVIAFTSGWFTHDVDAAYLSRRAIRIGVQNKHLMVAIFTGIGCITGLNQHGCQLPSADDSNP